MKFELYYNSANKITISLVVDKLSMQLIDGRVVSFYVEKERLMRILRHQVIYTYHVTAPHDLFFYL